METKPFVIDTAPGKILLPFISLNKDLGVFKEYYRVRKRWWGYPIIHDGIISYSIFDDLRLTSELKATFLPAALEIAETESKRSFNCALILMLELIDGFQVMNSKVIFQNRLIALRPKVENLSFISNVPFWWNRLIENVVGEGAVKYYIEPTNWKTHLPIELPCIENDFDFQTCPKPMNEILDFAREFTRDWGVQLDFVRNLIYEDKLYWFWKTRIVGNSSMSGDIIFIKKPPMINAHFGIRYSCKNSYERIAFEDIYGYFHE